MQLVVFTATCGPGIYLADHHTRYHAPTVPRKPRTNYSQLPPQTCSMERELKTGIHTLQLWENSTVPPPPGDAVVLSSPLWHVASPSVAKIGNRMAWWGGRSNRVHAHGQYRQHQITGCSNLLHILPYAEYRQQCAIRRVEGRSDYVA